VSVIMKKKARGMTRRPVSRIDLRYNRFVQNSVQRNTRLNIHDAQNESTETIKKYIFSFKTVNQELIGSQFFTLLYQARFEREKYQYQRMMTLKEIFQFVEQNHAWMDLWRTFSEMEYRLFERQAILSHQLIEELFDMLRLHAKYPYWIMGVDGEKPIWGVPPLI
jgi:hypothetical protein